MKKKTYKNYHYNFQILIILSFERLNFNQSISLSLKIIQLFNFQSLNVPLAHVLLLYIHMLYNYFIYAVPRCSSLKIRMESISILKYVKINDVKISSTKTAIKANTAKFLSIKAIRSLGFPSD